MNYKVYIRHITWDKKRKSKSFIVKSSSTTGAAKFMLNNLKLFNLSFYTSENLGYTVTKVLKIKG